MSPMRSSRRRLVLPSRLLGSDARLRSVSLRLVAGVATALVLTKLIEFQLVREPNYGLLQCREEGPLLAPLSD